MNLVKKEAQWSTAHVECEYECETSSLWRSFKKKYFTRSCHSTFKLNCTVVMIHDLTVIEFLNLHNNIGSLFGTEWGTMRDCGMTSIVYTEARSWSRNPVAINYKNSWNIPDVNRSILRHPL